MDFFVLLKKRGQKQDTEGLEAAIADKLMSQDGKDILFAVSFTSMDELLGDTIKLYLEGKKKLAKRREKKLKRTRTPPGNMGPRTTSKRTSRPQFPDHHHLFVGVYNVIFNTNQRPHLL